MKVPVSEQVGMSTRSHIIMFQIKQEFDHFHTIYIVVGSLSLHVSLLVLTSCSWALEVLLA